MDQYGNVFIEGSKPIDVVAAARRRYSYTLGYLMGVCAPPLKLPDKQPTAYSYNGVVLPKLPEWDKTVYPYAVIVYFPVEDTAWLWVSVADGYYKDDYDAGSQGIWEVISVPENSYYGRFDYTTTDSFELKYIDRKNVTGALFVGNDDGSSYLLWSNYDVMDESGGLYLAKSDPIPVYE